MSVSVGMPLPDVVGDNVEVAGSDGAVNQPLMDVLPAVGQSASLHAGNAAPVADQGIASLVTPSVAPRAKGLDNV